MSLHPAQDIVRRSYEEPRWLTDSQPYRQAGNRANRTICCRYDAQVGHGEPMPRDS
jgi:hypothetical protein